jgi:hypothetical protein
LAAVALYNPEVSEAMHVRAYLYLADFVLVAHLAFIGWVIFGAIFTRRRRWLAWMHIASLVYGIVSELTPLACPLTLAENWCEAQAGVMPYHGPFLLHYLDAAVYPNLPAWLLVTCGVVVCAFNLAIYAVRWRRNNAIA